jgi:hypothetical protein
VVIYLTPYIVRKSGDLKRLRTALSELENIQTRYNTFVREGLNKEHGYEGDDVYQNHDKAPETNDPRNRLKRNRSY